MAWGGMHRKHGRTAWAERERWLPLVRQLRCTDVSRSAAYEAFDRLRIQGLGPAYFTKLIYFLRQCDDGYILDQWTGKSVSILFDQNFIEFDHGGLVSRKNPAHVYERYCVNVEHLARRIGKGPPETEELLFSRGGRSKHPWREYVVSNWRTPEKNPVRTRAPTRRPASRLSMGSKISVIQPSLNLLSYNRDDELDPNARIRAVADS
jgi:hypothetical protein